MTTVVLSDEGQVPLPADLRQRLGLGAGARLELSEEPDGLRLRVLRARSPTDIANLAGMIKAPSRGVPCRLEDFDCDSPYSQDHSE
ncbi:MAG: AbrB/MazE/SpoVT family DNA-binding domain-containing protein [Candidatus Thiosymbion ectosymbiont of Robbea hypermnestra]|nr:AbrB/MazE/SpoVT family DNA-binding domain-containing protein [Candidatus Thiosymbion ectosymbiont of Robbea hypermnestra]